MAKQKVGTDFALIEKIFSQLSSSVSIALLKDDKLAYEFYGGRKNPDSAGRAEKGDAGRDGPSGPSVNRTTRFNIGSASALFTGALIVKLMEFGEVGLNDAIRRFIPEFPYGDVTVYHLLTHTSGLNAAVVPPPDNQDAAREFYRKIYEGLRRDYAPAVKSEYFRYGYAMLADAVCRISGQTLEELASVLLFMPPGMKYTTYNGAALRDNQYVIPWNHKENRFMSELHAKYPTGQNGVYTTALDLIRFGRLFLNGGEYDGKAVFLESSVDFLMREITNSKFMRTPVFMIKRQVDIFGCFSEKLSAGAVALTGDTGGILFIDPARRTVGAALTNSTWVHSVSRNYSNITDILMSI